MGAAAATAGTVSVGNSALFKSASSQYLSRTPDTNGNNKIATFSTWFYHMPTGADQTLFAATAGAADIFQLYIDNNDDIILYNYSSGYDWQYVTDMKFRDGGWIHFCFGIDTSQSSASDRVKLEINGVTVTDFSTSSAPSLNFANDFNTASNPMRVGSYDGSNNMGNNYMAESVWIDGTRYSASSFGEFDSTGLYWTPKSSASIKALTFGTNGFYLDNTTNAQTDASGEGNNFTNNNSVTIDVNSPTNISGLINQNNPNVATLSNGNKTVTSTGSGDMMNGVCTLPCTGKVYFEFEYTVTGTHPGAGIVETLVASAFDDYVGGGSTSWGWYFTGGDLYNGGSAVESTPSTLAVNTRGCIAFDTATGKFWTGQLSGSTVTWDNSGDPAAGSNPITSSISTSKTWSVVVSGRNSCSMSLYTTSTDFEISALPSGFTAIDTTNIASDTSRTASDTNKYFETTLYEGTGSEQSVQSDTTTNTSAFSWIKNRDATDNHMLFDRVRGATKDIHSNATAIEATNAQTVKAFTGGGVTLGTDDEVNTSSESFVLWNWMIGTSGSGSSNEDGSINTTATLVDTTLGLSVSKYTGTGANATVGHGLGVAPEFIMIKNLEGTYSWLCYHSGIGNTKAIFLDLANGADTNSVYFNNTSPTSSVFSIGTTEQCNQSSIDYIAYCFAPSQFISVGSFTGNESTNGPFVPTINSAGVPIQPAWIMIKNTVQSRSWIMWDKARSPYNVSENILEADTTTAEQTGSTFYMDIDTGGFKIRGSHEMLNGAETMIYLAMGTPIIDTSGRILAGR